MRFKINEIMSNIYGITSKEDYKRIDNMITYIRSYEFGSDKETEKISLDILYMIEDGINNGQSLDEIIGTNDKEFVDEIFKNFKDKSTFGYIIIGACGLIIGFYTLMNYFNFYGFAKPLTFFTILTYIFIGLLVDFSIWTMCKTVYNIRNRILYGVIILLMIFLFVYLRESFEKYDFIIPKVYASILSLNFIAMALILKYRNEKLNR